MYQLLKSAWYKQDFGTIVYSEIDEWRRNGWIGRMREDTIELWEWWKKQLNWENGRRNGYILLQGLPEKAGALQNKNRHIYVMDKTEALFKQTCNSQDFAECQ
jgi:hypothetical protein